MDIQKSNVKMKMQWTISIQMLGYFYMVHATCLLWLYIKNLDMKCMKYLFVFPKIYFHFQNMFYNSFYYGVYRIVARNLEEDMKLGDEGDMTGYLFAQSIIKKYRNFYDTSL